MKIGRIGQAEITMHPAMPVVIAALLLSSQRPMVGVMLATLALHETAHALCARALGMRITQIELMPFGGAVRLEGYAALSGWRGAVIAAAGPVSNALVVMLCATLVQYGVYTPADLRGLVSSNLMLMLLNALPILPMDGGRVACALLSCLFGEDRCRRLLSLLGAALSLALIGVGVWGAWRLGVVNLTLFLMGSYLLYAALSERRIPIYRQMEGLMGKQSQLLREQALALRHTVAYQEIPVYRLAACLGAREMHRICVVDERVQPVGTVEEEDIVRAMMKNPLQPLREVLEAKRKL